MNAGVGAVMVGHIALPQIDATAVKPLPKNMRSNQPTLTKRARSSREGDHARDDVAGDGRRSCETI